MRNRFKGILYILLAAFFFSLMNVFVRLSGDLPTMQKALFRNLIAAFIAWGILLRDRQPIHFDRPQLTSLLLRSSIGALGVICNFYAVDHLNISDANMLNKLSPFFAILMSLFILKEKVKGYEWLSVAIAFSGALLVIKPGFSMSAGSAFIGMLGGLCAGIAYTYVRKASKQGVPGTVIVMFFSTFSTIVMAPYVLLKGMPMTTAQLCFLLGAGITAAGGQMAITAAYAQAPAKEISVYDYTQVIFAAIWGILLFRQIPDGFSILGYGVILSAAILRTVMGNRRE